MDIILKTSGRRLVLPVVPNEMPTVSSPQANGSFESVLGEINVIGPMGLRTVTIESQFPVREYGWMRPGSSADGMGYVRAIERGRRRGEPMRVIILDRDGAEYLNMSCTADSFEYHADRAGDIAFSLTLREYRPRSWR